MPIASSSLSNVAPHAELSGIQGLVSQSVPAAFESYALPQSFLGFERIDKDSWWHLEGLDQSRPSLRGPEEVIFETSAPVVAWTESLYDQAWCGLDMANLEPLGDLWAQVPVTDSGMQVRTFSLSRTSLEN